MPKSKLAHHYTVTLRFGRGSLEESYLLRSSTEEGAVKLAFRCARRPGTVVEVISTAKECADSWSDRGQALRRGFNDRPATSVQCLPVALLPSDFTK